MSKHLLVFLSGDLCGHLYQDDSGKRTFTYEEGYEGPILSLSMPEKGKPYGPKQVDAFLFGLLPDKEEVRLDVAHHTGGSPNNPFTLLEYMGLDCPGAIQICPEDEAHLIGERGAELVPVSDEDIAARLRPESGRDADTWYSFDEERWSLGGNQQKFALRWKDGRWYACLGSAATTHIFKPGVSGMRYEALDEYVCMKLSTLCGIESEEVDYQLFCGEPAIIATRYDRIVLGDEVRRLHQEDICQALSVMPMLKYAQDGGPSTPKILALLRGLTNPKKETERFTQMLFWNYVLAAPDAHGKNYSVLHLPQGRSRLAPLYDVATILPYDRRPQQTRVGSSRFKPVRLAMSIGGENRVGLLQAKHIRAYADDANLDPQWCVDLMGTLCVEATRHLHEAFADVQGIPGAEELEERLTPRLQRHCRQIIAAL